MPVDETGQQAAPLKVDFRGLRRHELVLLVADGNNFAAADQHMTNAQGLGREDLGIAKEFQQGMGPGIKKRGVILHYPANRQQMTCHRK